MNVDEHGAPSAAQHYSGRNRFPNIQEFMNQLDAEKKSRDAEIDNDLKRNSTFGEAKAHVNEDKLSKKGTKTVRDPVTGKDVEIRNADISFKDAVEDPQVFSSIFYSGCRHHSVDYLASEADVLSLPCPTRILAKRPRSP